MAATTVSARRTGRKRALRRPSAKNLPVPPALAMELLRPLYGPVEWKPRYNALDELIFTVLTQHTSDLNAERAFESLRARMPRWEDVLEAPVEAVTDAIRSGGLANQKSVRIQHILRDILARHGSFDLEFLRSLSLDEAKAWLQALPGVGPKTAAVVLSFALGMPAMPVDTHIHRVSKRIGLISPKTTADDAHDILEALTQPEDRFELHVLLITHGRRICKAPRPRCAICPLREPCPSSAVYLKEESDRAARKAVSSSRQT